MARTWWRYLAAAALFMTLEPMLWGYECSDQFPSGISYHIFTAALLFTTSITWAMGPVAFLVALPLARRFGWFWAEIPGHVRERAIGSSEWTWESGRGEAPEEADPVQEGLPIRIFIFAPFIALVLVMVGATASEERERGSEVGGAPPLGRPRVRSLASLQRDLPRKNRFVFRPSLHSARTAFSAAPETAGWTALT